ncbi:hypothetical protein IEQ34_010766 [Dendrobium chrysotoxum]|uniref:Uncharacterized protein n=1 Tax=Dendrobium chrysotoxum TaxID=161865 RepID=A0AAV7GWK5_DENCH|nr:hypothetical protein IEQ34_010766 [Dendrobium chrysotoxum]
MWDCGSPLYDSFELSSLFHIIDKHMMKLPFLLSRSSPEREGRVEMTEVTDVVAVRRLKMKKEKRSKRRRAVGLRAIFSAIISLKKFNDKHHFRGPSPSSYHNVEWLEPINQSPLTSYEKKIWRPKEEDASLAVDSPEKLVDEEPIGEEKLKINPPDHMDCERYVPVDLHYIFGRSIEELLGELKDNIKNLEDEEALNLNLE